MIRLLRDGLEAGGFGFSTTTSDTHNDDDGTPGAVALRRPPRSSSSWRGCAASTRGRRWSCFPGATGLGPFADDVADLMITMSVTAQRPLNWNVIQPHGLEPRLVPRQARCRRPGRRPRRQGVGLTMPVDMKARFSFHAGFVLDVFEGWAPIMNASTDEKLRVLQRPTTAGAAGRAGRRRPRACATWPSGRTMSSSRRSRPRRRRYAGRRVGDIAEELGKEPFDALVDIAIADGLRTTFMRGTADPTAADWAARLQIWNDPRAMIGASDAGAHLDMIAAFRYSTGFLEEGVRQHQLLPLERAVHLLTGAPARLYGLRDRGVLARGRAGRHRDLRRGHGRLEARRAPGSTCRAAPGVSTPRPSASTT